MIAVLKAEWHLLNRPERLQAAAERHLDVQPLGILQLARLSDLPERPPRADEIGRKLEALGLLEPTATPKDHRAARRAHADRPYPGEVIPCSRRTRRLSPRPPAIPAKADSSRALRGLLRLSPDKSTARIGLVAVCFAGLFLALGGRLVVLAVAPEQPGGIRRATSSEISAARPDITDRNGETLATDVKTVSVFAEPRNVLDKDEAVELLTAVLPELDARELRERLNTRRGFIWVKREITPRQQAEVHRLGIPGVGFVPENKRVYPNGVAAAHVLGFANIDNVGIAGIEKYIDAQGLQDLNGAGFAVQSADLTPIALSIDLRAQHALRDELAKALDKYKAKAAAGTIVDVNTGEVVALVSLPDFDPNNPVDALDKERINRINVGVYEMGSTFKAITTAMALDSGKFTINSTFDARAALRYGRFTINDFHAQHRVMTRPGGVHLLLQYRHGAHGARHRRRRPQGVPAQDGTARPPAHRAARERRADHPAALGRAQHHDHRLRAWSCGGAPPGRNGDRGARERRVSRSRRPS